MTVSTQFYDWVAMEGLRIALWHRPNLTKRMVRVLVDGVEVSMMKAPNEPMTEPLDLHFTSRIVAAFTKQTDFKRVIQDTVWAAIGNLPDRQFTCPTCRRPYEAHN